MKKCPFCSEEIQDSAMKCRFCGEWLKVEKEKQDIEISIQKSGETIGNKEKNWFHIIPVWRFILYTVLSLGFYPIDYIGRMRLSLQERGKIQPYTGWKKFLWFNRWFSIKLIYGINELLKEKWIDKKISPILISIFYWFFLLVWCVSFQNAGQNESIFPIYISTFFLSLPFIPVVRAINKYSANEEKISKTKMKILQEIILVLIWILIMVGSFVDYKEKMLTTNLVEIVNNINKSTPKMIDEESRLDNAEILPGNIIQFNWTLLNIEKDTINIEELRTIQEKNILDGLRTNKKVQFLWTMIYSYNDKNWVNLFKIEITPKKYKSLLNGQ